MFISFAAVLPTRFGVLLCRYADRSPDPRFSDADELLRVCVLDDVVYTHRELRGRVHHRRGRVGSFPKVRVTSFRSGRGAVSSVLRSLGAAERAGFVPLSGLVPFDPAEGEFTVRSLPERLGQRCQDVWSAVDGFAETRVSHLVSLPLAVVFLPRFDDGFPAPRVSPAGLGSFTFEVAGPVASPFLVLRVPPGFEPVLAALFPFAGWVGGPASARFALSLLESFPPGVLTRERFHKVLAAVSSLAA